MRVLFEMMLGLFEWWLLLEEVVEDGDGVEDEEDTIEEVIEVREAKGFKCC
jgi:hypothetical protein